MDIFTQGLLGGVLARAAARDSEKKQATLVGGLAGLLADADILIRSSSDSLLNIEYHRHFSHSLIFIPVGAAIAMMLLWPFLRRQLSIRRLYLFCLLGYSMSGMLDACTSYGTHLLWPFSDERVAFNIISIIDPVFTLILLATLVLGLRMQGRRVAHAGLIACVSYLLLGSLQHHRAETVAEQLASSRGHAVTRHVVKPTMANLLLWRSVYIADGRIYVDAIRAGFGKNQVLEGDSLMQFDVERDLPDLDRSSTLYHDINRFISFSDGYVAYDPSQSNVLGDIRYSMLPISTRPLWGISIRPDQPGLHSEYRFFRDTRPSVRQQFLELLAGNRRRSAHPVQDHVLPAIH